MCGIAGTLEFNGGTPDATTLERMIRTIAHRGPDGIRAEVATPAGLAHARLRVIDLSPQADQPLWNEDRSIAVMFNGEIYNFPELRRELSQRGFRFRTRSDTEVILRLYERLGEDSIPRLDGMFAIALWDARRGRLLLARDRAGKKPLFYYQDGRRLAFASEIKALHAHPEIGRQPNLEALPLYLTYGYFPAPATAYSNVSRVPPATVVSIDSAGHREERRFWVPPHRVNGHRSEAEAADELRRLLDRAVAKRLLSDVPLGAFLSGGMDSTVVVGLMSRKLGKPVRTFAIGFRDAPDFDETSYAELAAGAFGTEHTTFRVDPPEGEFLERLVHHHDGPFGDSSAIPTYVVSQLARQQVTVVLNGDGGDELFAGYPRFRWALQSSRIPSGLRTCGAALSQLIPEMGGWSSPLRRMKRFLEVATLSPEEKLRAGSSFFPQAARELFVRLREPDKAEAEIADHFRGPLAEVRDATPLSRLLHLYFQTYLTEDLLVKMDRSTMAHGLEARSPFLDTDLIEFAGRLPDDFKLRGNTSKYLLREAYKTLVPSPILHRSKMGFSVPLDSWFQSSLRPYLQHVLGSESARLYEWVRRDVVRSHLEAQLKGSRDLSHRLFCLLTLEIWLKSL